MTTSLETQSGLFDKILNTILRFRWWALVVVILTSLGAAYVGRSIPTNLSLIGLLPDQRESVQDLKAVSKEFGGVGYLGVIIGPYKKGPEKFLSLAAKSLRSIPEIRYSFYERETYTLREKALYLIARKDFDDLVTHTETLMNDGKTGGLLDLGFDDHSDREAKIQEAKSFFSDLRAKYLPNEDLLEPKFHRYFLSPDGLYATLWLKPSFDSEDLELSKKLIADVQSNLKSRLPEDVPFALWGRYLNHVTDTEQIQKDITLTSLVSLIGVALVLILGLGTLRGALATVVCMCFAMGWTLGFAQVAVGQINIVTGFLLAILGGLGVEYGIHLIRRYYQEIKAGKSRDEALEISYKVIGRALLSAALTSSGAFFILSFSEFRGFSELGRIAGFGILAIYVIYMLSFPAIATLLPPRQRFPKVLELFGFFPFSRHLKWLIPPVMILTVFGIQKAFFEYDFSKLQELSEETRNFDRIMEKILPRSTTPAALLTENPKQAAQLNEYLENLRQDEIAARETLDSTLSMSTIVPPDMKERREKLESFRRNIGRISNEDIKNKTGIDGELVRAWVMQSTYKMRDLPINLWDGLGSSGKIVLAYSKVDLSHISGIKQFSALLQKAKQQFPFVKIGSDVRIFEEILNHIVHDGRIIMLIFLLGAFGVLWADFQSWREALALEIQLIAGIALLVGLMGFFGVPFTILNVAMVPAVLAAGIDMGVHVRHRELETGEGGLRGARFVAQAVQLGALTTVIGFGSLFLAHASMLKGIAWISCLGQLSMYLICMFIWPVSKSAVRKFYNLRRARITQT